MLLILFSLVYSKRTTSPLLYQHIEQISQKNYTHNIDSTLLLQYNDYPGVYSMEFGEIVDGVYVNIQQNLNLDPFTLPGCHHYNRRLIYKQLDYQEINSNKLVFTNMYVDNNFVYVTRNDNSLCQFEIKLDEQNRKIIGLELQEIYQNSGFSQQHQLICYNKICLIFGEKGQTFLYKDQNFSLINLTQIIGEFREFPKDIYFDEKSKVIYICYGNQIIDVLKFTNNSSIKKAKKIISGEKIVQVKTNPESTILYLLDQNIGLISYYIAQNLEYILTSFHITLQNCVAFDFYENTFFIVAETQNHIPYALEVLQQDDTYYFNKIYSKDIDIYDVWVGKYFAILIGTDIHKIIYHSVFQKFVEQSEIPLLFQDINLVKVEEFRKWENSYFNQEAIDQEPFQSIPLNYKQTFMVGISQSQLSVFSVKQLSPWLQCKPTSYNSIEYSLKMNSTSCSLKQKENDYTAFKQCNIFHNFTITGKEIYFYENVQSYAIFESFFIGIGILLILFYIAANLYQTYTINRQKNHLYLNEQQELENIQPENHEN